MGSDLEERNRAKLLDKAYYLFLAEGFARFGMETIALRLGVSKATLYKYFPNKEALVDAVVGLQISLIDGRVTELSATARDFPARMTGFLGIILGLVQRSARAFLQDVMKTAPRQWQRIVEFRRDRIFPYLTSLVNEGIRLGYMRGDLKGEALAPILVAIIEALGQPEYLLDLPLSMDEVMVSTARIIFQGILSDTGRGVFKDLGSSLGGTAPNASVPGGTTKEG